MRFPETGSLKVALSFPRWNTSLASHLRSGGALRNALTREQGQPRRKRNRALCSEAPWNVFLNVRVRGVAKIQPVGRGGMVRNEQQEFYLTSIV
jgi:hypothetical protein